MAEHQQLCLFACDLTKPRSHYTALFARLHSWFQATQLLPTLWVLRSGGKSAHTILYQLKEVTEDSDRLFVLTFIGGKLSMESYPPNVHLPTG